MIQGGLLSVCQEVVSLLRFHHKLDVVVRQLACCDYIVSNRMAVERRSLSGRHTHTQTDLTDSTTRHLHAVTPSHTRLFSRPVSGTTRVSRYHKGKTNLDFTEARDCEWQWHQLGHMQVCTSLQTDNHASTPTLSFFTDRMPFLPPNQQRQSSCVRHGK